MTYFAIFCLAFYRMIIVLFSHSANIMVLNTIRMMTRMQWKQS